MNKTDRKKAGYIPFDFSSKHLQLFNKLKEATRNSLPLHQIDFTKPIYCFSDASKMSISFVAFQLGMDDKGWLDDPAMSDDDKRKRIANAVLSPNGPEKNRILFIT